MAACFWSHCEGDQSSGASRECFIDDVQTQTTATMAARRSHSCSSAVHVHALAAAANGRAYCALAWLQILALLRGAARSKSGLGRSSVGYFQVASNEHFGLRLSVTVKATFLCSCCAVRAALLVSKPSNIC
jgi:hypothetical protein